MPPELRTSRRAWLGGLAGAAALAACRDDGPTAWTEAEAARDDPFRAARERLGLDRYVTPFGSRAPWNVPVRGLRRDPDSDTLVDRLWNEATPDRPGNVNLGFESYTFPVYLASDATFEAIVHDDGGRSSLHGERIPWNPAWRAAPGTDGQVIVLDPDSGREWDLWRVRAEGGIVRIDNGNLVPGSYWTREVGYPPSRGSGIPYLAMLVRPQEILMGEIRHALAMVVPNTDGRSFVAPATKLEHPDDDVIGIPQATRYALAIDDAAIDAWLREKGRHHPAPVLQFGRILARALRDYGWFVTDTGGSATLQFEARVSAGPIWSELGVKGAGEPGEAWPRDLLDGLLLPERIYAITPSDRYPPELRARGEPEAV